MAAGTEADGQGCCMRLVQNAQKHWRRTSLISIKKYLDTDSTSQVIDESEANELLTATMDSYRSALRAMGKSAVEACPATARDLEKGLTGLAGQLSLGVPAKAVEKNLEIV